MQPKDIRIFQRKLLAWYQKNARDLPWRRTKEPYKIWVSEIMLQQTQVDTAIPYYERWIKQFPSLKKCAQSPLSTVMKYWAGLGYYRRVRMLHEAAKMILKEFKGQIPQTAQELLKIPGIGRYTAGAIASIAYEERVPILDGNVIRILTRLFAIQDDVGSPNTIRRLWEIAENVLPETNVGDFNQAMMELGATNCSPKQPSCITCPVGTLCNAHLENRETAFPVKFIKEKSEKLKTAALIFRKYGKVLVEKQPDTGRWGGLWMFPHWKSKRSMIRESKIAANDLDKCLNIKHGYTKYRIELEVFEVRSASSYSSITRSPTVMNKWVSLKNLRDYAFPSPHQKIVNHLLK